jgi:HEAT repeat protein
MPRLVHVAPVSAMRSIERAGIRGTRWELASGRCPVVLPRAVFAMPVVPDFAATYQWVRELRRWQGERMVAVHLSLSRDEPVYVGRYGKPHELRTLGDAIGWVRLNQAGAQIVIPRSVSVREVCGVREVSQLVGWVETPESRSHYDCVCLGCLPPGRRDVQRRVRAAFAKCLLDARDATDDDTRIAALGRMSTPLERARGKISPRGLLGYSRSESDDVRRTVAGTLSEFRATEVTPTLLRLAADASPRVRSTAVASLVRVLGVERAGKHLEDSPPETLAAYVGELDCAPDVGRATKLLRRLATRTEPEVGAAVRRTARALLAEEGIETEVRNELEAMSNDSGAVTTRTSHRAHAQSPRAPTTSVMASRASPSPAARRSSREPKKR